MADRVLIDAIRQRNLEQVRTLLREGIEINKEEWNGFTPLIFAACYGRSEIASLLIEYGASINRQSKDGTTALHWACTNNQASIVSLLIEKGADVNIQDKIGTAPLMISAFHRNYSILSYLLRNGANLSLLDYSGKTALDIARERYKSDCIVILEKYEVWLSFSTSLRSFHDNQNQNQESKQIHIQSQIRFPSLMRVMDSSDLVRYVTEFM